VTALDAPPETVSAGIGDNPFVGPRSIQRGEPIYGRTREIDEVCSTLVAARIVLLYAVSGAGKTSLLEAGLRPALESRDFAVLPTVRVGHDASNLDGRTASNRYTMSTLLSLEEGRPEDVRLEPGELSAMSVQEYVDRFVVGRDDDLDPCIFFDQFEELFTLDPVDEPAKRDFIGDLGVALRDAGLWALFAMREDFIAQLDPYASMIPEAWETRFRLELLGPPAAKAAMQETTTGAGRVFVDDAAELLIDDLRRVRVQRGAASVEELGPHVEPVQLQVVCRELWGRMDPEDLSIDASDVRALGDVNDALGRFYDDALAVTSRHTGVPTYSLRRWFSEVLITPFGTRGIALRGPEATQDLPNRAVDSLEDLHMIRAETRSGARWYELTHDRFIEPVRASNARALSVRSPSLWGLVPLIVGVALAIALVLLSVDDGTGGTVLYFVCGGLVGLGLGELLATALDRDARRLLPRRTRRGWRLVLGIATLLVAALCLAGAAYIAFSHPDADATNSFPTYASGLGFTVSGAPTCNGTSLRLFTHQANPGIGTLRVSTRISRADAARIIDIARRWCRSEARYNIIYSLVYLALAVGLISLVVITWRRRRHRRAIAPATPALSAPPPESPVAPSERRRAEVSGTPRLP